MAEDKTPEAEPVGKEKAAEAQEATKKTRKQEKAEKAEKEEKKAPQPKKGDYGPDFRYIVRLADTDLDGTKSVGIALTGIKGVGHRMSALVAQAARVDGHELIGNLTEEQTDTIQERLDAVADEVPGWVVNRPIDVESGDDLHMVGAEVDAMLRDDLNRLKKIRAYRGIRHEAGLPVRGQRTRANGRTGLTVGVQRQKIKEAKAAAKEGES
jgi:small subunit ribosomal protein S13